MKDNITEAHKKIQIHSMKIIESKDFIIGGGLLINCSGSGLRLYNLIRPTDLQINAVPSTVKIDRFSFTHGISIHCDFVNPEGWTYLIPVGMYSDYHDFLEYFILKYEL
jgi:hypothetical protein